MQRQYSGNAETEMRERDEREDKGREIERDIERDIERGIERGGERGGERQYNAETMLHTAKPLPTINNALVRNG